jgi:hypothetical protein
MEGNLNRRTDLRWLVDRLGAELTYQYPILREHRAMLAAIRKLIMSFVPQSAEK